MSSLPNMPFHLLLFLVFPFHQFHHFLIFSFLLFSQFSSSLSLHLFKFQSNFSLAFLIPPFCSFSSLSSYFLILCLFILVFLFLHCSLVYFILCFIHFLFFHDTPQTHDINERNKESIKPKVCPEQYVAHSCQGRRQNFDSWSVTSHQPWLCLLHPSVPHGAVSLPQHCPVMDLLYRHCWMQCAKTLLM